MSLASKTLVKQLSLSMNGIETMPAFTFKMFRGDISNEEQRAYPFITERSQTA